MLALLTVASARKKRKIYNALPPARPSRSLDGLCASILGF
jgi:hypothetical protein